MSEAPTNDLSRLIREVNTLFREFVKSGRLLPLSDFVFQKPPIKSRTRELAKTLNIKVDLLDHKLTAQKLSDKVPMSKVPKSELEYFYSTVLPAKYDLYCLGSDNPDFLLELEEMINDFNIESSSQDEKDILKMTMEAMLINLINYATSERDAYASFIPSPEDIDEELLRELLVCIRSKYFHPQGWLSRSKSTNFLHSKRELSKYPMNIRGRLQEAYESFIVGHYFACIVTCRSLAEYILIDRAKPKYDFDPYEINRGKKQAMRLEKLIEKIRRNSSEMASKLDFVRAEGNRLLHPPKGREIDVFPPQGESAKKCIHILFDAIEEMYS